MLTVCIHNDGDLCFAQGSIVRLLVYKNDGKSYYVDFTTTSDIPNSVEYDGTVETLKHIIKGVYSRLSV